MDAQIFQMNVTELVVSHVLSRRLFVAAIVLLAMMVASPAPTRAADERETIHLAAGSIVTIALTDNPSTGYRWRLDEAASTDLSLVDIADAGFEPGGAKLVGAPGTRRFRIVARRAGTAVAVFEYGRSWERAGAIRRHVVNIEISDR